MAKPKRIQRQGTKGWRMPAGAVYVGRPGRWGNPFIIGQDIPIPEDVTPLRSPEPCTVDDLEKLRPDLAVLSAEHAVDLFRGHIESWPGYADRARAELAGRDLACWCPSEAPCHADVLLEIANL